MKTDGGIPVDLHCPNCSYNVRGLTEWRCPECGRTFTYNDLPLMVPARRPWRTALRNIAQALGIVSLLSFAVAAGTAVVLIVSILVFVMVVIGLSCWLA